MKILIAADLHWPTINGVATFSRNLAEGLAARGHEVLVVAPSQRKSGLPYQESDGHYEIIRTMSVPFPFYQNFRISVSPRREMQKTIRGFQPDVIHIQMLLGIGQAAMRYAKRYEIPVVTTNHAIPENLLDNIRLLAPISKPISYLLTEYGARFHAKANYVTMPTQLAIDTLLSSRKDTPSVPIEAVSNGINLHRFTTRAASSEIYKTFNIPHSKTIISYIGRLDGEKHIDTLLYAFAELAQGRSDAHLLVVGFGTDAERLHSIVRELGLQRSVTFTGKVSDDEIVALHKVGRIFCMPSPAELQCIAMLEAMASGKPVVAVRAGALPELCHDGINGILCAPDEASQMAAALRTLIEDPALCKKYGAQSVAIAKKHDIQYTLDRFEEIYKLVMARSVSG